ncbi:dephospho-CoA kinase [Sulfurovum sp. XGS-02]|uniref:dephospho-CoA kinase n=1 Tax=Sulfurovum sp. XGS-02 TaxID=2925411 RepID=UPI00200A16D9|nr:dephospho-CoA kinase [Sulfurovum sp. XGS-02]UPT77503.1 dephospho-CoA kinase [Sulfurovum sp. XGS-02]
MAFKYAIALTGSIATGKSSTVKLLEASGFHIIDADKIAHKILDEQHEAIAEKFGETLVHEGKVDRKALGAIVFSDKEKRKALEALLHPLIYEEIERLSLEQDRLRKPYFIDIPLFFENERYPIKKSLVVYTTEEKQLERLMQREGYTKEEALNRIEAQIPVEEKRKRATYVIDNSGTLTQLEKECERVKEEILNDSN